MSRKLCNSCGASRGIQEFPDGKYCHACHKQFKEKSIIVQKKTIKSPDLELPTYMDEPPPEFYNYLKKYYITGEDIERCNIFWSEKYQRVCFPYYSRYGCAENDKTYMLFCWMRSIDPNEKNKWVFVGQKNIEMYWFQKALKMLKDMDLKNDFDPIYEEKILCIVEDQISCVRVSNHLDCVSLGGTNINNPLLLPLLLKYDKIVLWLDGDEAGRRASDRFIKKYKLYREIRSIYTPKDPKTYTDKEIQEILK